MDATAHTKIAWPAPAAGIIRGARPARPFLLLTTAMIATTLPTHAGRPLVVDDAAPVSPRNVEVEFGGVFERRDSVRHYDLPLGLAYGVVETFEASVGFGGQIEQRQEELQSPSTESGVGDLLLGAKWHPLPEAKSWASHALAFSVKFPTADYHNDLGSGETDFDLTYIASKTLGERWAAHLNVGYTFTGDPAEEPLDDLFHAGLALGWQARDRLEFVVEMYADTPIPVEADTAVTINGGLRWRALDALTLDAAVGHGLHGGAPDWIATIGLTWAFGPTPNQRAE